MDMGINIRWGFIAESIILGFLIGIGIGSAGRHIEKGLS